MSMIILREKERIIHVARRHWWVITSALALPSLAIFLVLLVRYRFNFTFFGYAWQALVIIIGAAVAWGALKVFIWSRNVLIVTSQRLVRHEQRGIFDELVNDLLYQDISDISFKRVGMAAAMHDYGTLIIRTIGERRMLLEKIHHPEQVVEIVNTIRLSLGARVSPHDKSPEL